MPETLANRKPPAALLPSGLRHGQAATIARIHRVSRQHVQAVALGHRTGSPALMRTIERYRDQNTASPPTPAAA